MSVEKPHSIKVLGGSKERYAYAGDVIRVSVMKYSLVFVTKGSVSYSKVAELPSQIRRPDGSTTGKLDKNAAVLLTIHSSHANGTRILDWLIELRAGL